MQISLCKSPLLSWSKGGLFAVFTVLVVSCPDPTLMVRIQAAYDNCPGYTVHVLTAGTFSHALLTDRSSMELLLKLAANHYSRHTVQPQN